ncbi:hypothetical protein D3C87_1714440 [compost metagenome]
MEDDLHAAQLIAGALAGIGIQLPTFEDDMTAGGGQNAGNGARQRRFSATGFADDAEIASGIDCKADGIDRTHQRHMVFAFRSISGDQLLDIQQRLRVTLF